jgi:thiosulfate dehydrogenase [quinone] large subunit
LGLFTRAALIAAFLLMATLMYGVTIVQNWDAASTQLIYCLVLFVLLVGVGYNRLALDNRFFGRQSQSLKERLQEGVLRFTGQRSPTRKYGTSAQLRK